MTTQATCGSALTVGTSMTDSDFIEKRANEVFEKFKAFIPEEYQATVLNDLIMGMLKCHIDVIQNTSEEEDEDD